MGHSLTKLEMAEKLQQDLGFSRKESKELVDCFFEEIISALENGEPVKISGFGNFELRDKSSRPGRNPKTGEEFAIEARRVVTFKAGRKLRDRIDAHGRSSPAE
ncbi:integration host factor subunit alpha [Marinagarivorans cellulosilyticus]|uniref:Integration host factor subunit alpha n=1 Tax=Marinagarivorans cellulosilyticus TaxID=2721545 RepID=A0AAN1WL05_9GAMM|nr:integration host factor subunit alpha [Marinagarivorans cellulosilyticus]BCD99447.1 integration host factor subunit alpha [Marinagarivorans cellulosilyticus]